MITLHWLKVRLMLCRSKLGAAKEHGVRVEACRMARGRGETVKLWRIDGIRDTLKRKLNDISSIASKVS